ncbi:MAG: peptide chain release factor N(5)-glutamine methyltransferase [bacterium]
MTDTLDQLPAAIRETGSSRELLLWAKEVLKRHQVVEAAYEARHLVARALAANPGLVQLASLTLAPDQVDSCAAMVARRVAGEPFQYLIGETGFRKGLFTCQPGVLIPRPETETLVDRAIVHLHQSGDKHWRILELGTGSGAPIISLALEFPRHTYVATDISQRALTLAEANAIRNGCVDRIAFLPGDWWDALRDNRVSLPFDLIITNPPYVAHSDIAELPTEIRDHEPHEALDGGIDGLAFYRRLVGELGEFLKPGGWVVAEVGDAQDDAVRIIFEHAGMTELATSSDLHGLPRVVEGRRRREDESE